MVMGHAATNLKKIKMEYFLTSKHEQQIGYSAFVFLNYYDVHGGANVQSLTDT